MEEQDNVEMFVAGLVLDPASNAPIVILKDATGAVVLPIWIGLAEATAIASALKKVEVARPMTHDLLQIVIDRLGGRVVRMVVTALRDNTFIANLEVAAGNEVHVIDCRPSDAIAVSVRYGTPIYVAADVLAHAQVTLVAAAQGAEGEAEGEEGAAAQSPGEDFASIDKDKWAEILAAMDPDDFKYKM